MQNSWASLFEIAEDVSAAAERDRCERAHLRFNEAWEGLVWLLARRGDRIGIVHTGAGREFRLYVQAGDELARTPQIAVVYSFETQTKIAIHGIRCEAETDEDEDPEDQV